MARFQKHFDTGSLLVILLTLTLFVAALVIKGLMHDMLLEAGVFLVSVKLVIMAYKNAVATDRLQERLDGIQAALQRLGQPPAPDELPRPAGAASRLPEVQRSDRGPGG